MVADQIVDYAQSQGALIVLASRGQSCALRWPLGSVADRILHNESVPTLLVPVSESY